jgi:surface polysaccharide O-acyltransferase-like enzyme
MRSRVISADVLRVSATFTVVILHTAAPLLYQFNSIDRSGWLIADVVDSCCRWAVPVFLMLSGMLLLGTSRSESLRSFFGKRVNKVVFPFIVWSIIYSFWSFGGHNIAHYIHEFIVNHDGFPYSVSGFAKDFLRGEVHYHLWYFYPLIALYIMTPVIRHFVKDARAKSLAWFLALWLVVAAAYGAICQISGVTDSGPAYYGTFAVVAIGYFVLGHYLNKVDIGKKSRSIIYVVAVVGLLISILGTYVWTSRSEGELQDYFYNYFSVTVIALSAAVFLAFSKVDWEKKLPDGSRASRLLADASSASLGIYLIHPLFLETLHMLKLHGMTIDATFVHPALAIPLVSIVTIAASFIAVRILQKVPLIRRIVP